MGREPNPVFLERGNYRRRRLMDAIKLVAVIGGGLWMIPLLWPTSFETGANPISMSVALMFVFGVWCLLIVVSAALIVRLRRDPGTEDREGSEE